MEARSPQPVSQALHQGMILQTVEHWTVPDSVVVCSTLCWRSAGGGASMQGNSKLCGKCRSEIDGYFWRSGAEEARALQMKWKAGLVAARLTSL